MAQIGNNIFISGLSGKLIIRWVLASNPLAEVGRNANPSTITFPVDMIYVIPNLAPVVYIVQFWRSDDGIALNQLIKDWSIDASQETTTVSVTYQYKVGRGLSGTNPNWADPNEGDTFIADQRLAGFTKDKLIVHEAGYGNHLDAEYNLHAGGGIDLVGGNTFSEGTAWFVTAFSTQTVTIPSSSGATLFSAVQVVTANRDLYVSAGDNLYNKLVLIEGAGTTVQINILDLSLIPDDTHVMFNTHKGSHNYLILQFDAGDTVKFLNQDVNVIYVAKGQIIWLYFKSGICRIIQEPSNAARRGMVAPDYDSNRDSDNGALIYADEGTGVLNKSDYPGLYAFAAQLSGTSVCNLGTASGEWSYDSGGGVFPNKRKWGIDTTAFTFRVPHLSGMIAKYSSTPGVYEADQVGPQELQIRDGFGGTATGTISNTGFSGQDNPGSFIDNGVAGAEKYIRPKTATTETRVKSYSQKPFIWL